MPASTSARVCVRASYTRSETQAYVCYHGSHNRCDFRANLLRCYGDGNLAEGGRKTEREGWDSKKKKKEGGDGTYYYCKYGALFPYLPSQCDVALQESTSPPCSGPCDRIRFSSPSLNFLHNEELEARGQGSILEIAQKI